MATITQYNFPVNATIDGLSLPQQSVFQGLGTGGRGSGGNYHFSINDTEAPGIFLNSNGSHSSGGTVLRNLSFQWVSPISTFTTDTCLVFSIWNDIAEGCNFTDCPVAINFSGLSCSAIRCTVSYGVNVMAPTDVTAFWIQGNQRWPRFFRHEAGVRYVMTPPIMPPLRSA